MEAEGTTLTTRSEPYYEAAIHAQAEINQTRMRTEHRLNTVTDIMEYWLRTRFGRGLPVDVACPLPVCCHGLDKGADTRLVCGVDIPPLKGGCLSDRKFSF